MKQSGKPPEKNTKEWIRNEKIINENPALRAVRDTSEGFRPTSGIKTRAPSQAYKDGWDAIFGRKDRGDKDETN